MSFGITCYGLKTIETKLKNVTENMDEQRAKDKIILKELEQIISEYNPEKIILTATDKNKNIFRGCTR